MKIVILIIILVSALIAPVQASRDPEKEIDAFLSAWHRAAAVADARSLF